MPEPLHDQIAALHGAVVALGRAEETGDPKKRAPAAAEEEAAKRLGQLLGRPLPKELRARIQKIEKRLGARKPAAPHSCSACAWLPSRRAQQQLVELRRDPCVSDRPAVLPLQPSLSLWKTRIEQSQSHHWLTPKQSH